MRLKTNGNIVDPCWASGVVFESPIGCLPEYPHILLDPLGVKRVTTNEGEHVLLSLCKWCHRSLNNKKTPAHALANNLFTGTVPPVLKDLTLVEESMISLCRAKCCILKLKGDNDVGTDEGNIPVYAQRALKGNIIIFPQDPSSVAKVLPPSLDELAAPICILFIGSEPPTKKWLQEKAKPLGIRPGKVQAALQWLKLHNPLYKDVRIDYELLASIPSEGYQLPVHLELVEPSADEASLTSGYNPTEPDNSTFTPLNATDPQGGFERVVIQDVDTGASSNQLRAAALRHVRKNSAYVEVPHGSFPANEFNNTTLYPMIYPTLFPYGIGGIDDPRKSTKLSKKRHF
ncbi:hypothetical protein VKT23_013072 [Stygiomarasmius scandens]|uniref:DUF6570 domain-containing protein n=1 Tax=Marasmiellus scandens TaxID=2682957 RepID=A0ABR1J4F8_9AGAR